MHESLMFMFLCHNTLNQIFLESYCGLQAPYLQNLFQLVKTILSINSRDISLSHSLTQMFLFDTHPYHFYQVQPKILMCQQNFVHQFGFTNLQVNSQEERKKMYIVQLYV